MAPKQFSEDLILGVMLSRVAFLSAMVGSEVAGTATPATIAALQEVDLADWIEIGSTVVETEEGGRALHEVDLADWIEIGSTTAETKEGEAFVAKLFREAACEAKSQLDKAQEDVEQSISDIIDAQMKEIQEKIVNFGDLDFQLEKEQMELHYMRDLLLADQLNLIQRKARLMSPQTGDARKIKVTNDVT